MGRIVGWIRDRMGLDPLRSYFLHHKVPRENLGNKGWMHALGTTTLAMFLLQLVTGVGLVTKYVPSPAHAYDSLVELNTEVWLGWLVRAMHYYGASAMVIFVGLHMARVYLTASYKFPREMNWISGVFLALFTMGMAYTGQLLRWDSDGYWTVFVGMTFIKRVPFIGDELAELFLAGNHLGGATLTRFFALHVFILPALILLFVSLHMYLLIHQGISEVPKAGQPVEPKTYRKRYAELKKRGGRYWPDSAWREVLVGVSAVAVVIALAIIYGPKGPGAPPDPTLLHTNPHPDWFLVWYFALLYLKPRGLESFIMVYLPLLALAALILFPILSYRGERHISKRPWALPVVLGVVLGFIYLTWLGLQAPWTPPVTLEPLRAPEIERLSDKAQRGAVLYVERGCGYCHRMLGQGGDYGPDLTAIGARLPAELISQRIIVGYGDMPSYQHALTDDELSALVAFFVELEVARR